MRCPWTRCVTAALIVALLTACENDIPLPEPAPQRIRRESDDWVKPGKMVQLRGLFPILEQDHFRIPNRESFDVMLIDDVWLSVSAPNVVVKSDGPYIGNGRNGWHVYLRCPAAGVIPAGSEITISYDTCVATTYEPGPGAQLRGFRVTAREGYFETAIEGGPVIIRKPAR
jgi:hypothetical protein